MSVTIQTLASGQPPGLTTIASGSCATGSPTVIDITSIPATYRAIILYVSGASNSVATRGLRVSVDTGLGLGNAGNVSGYTQIANTTTTSVSNAASLWTDITHAAALVDSCWIQFPAYQSGPIKTYNGFLSAQATAGSEWAWAGAGSVFVAGFLSNASVARTGAIVGIRLTWDNVATGVFDAGTYAVYGVQ